MQQHQILPEQNEESNRIWVFIGLAAIVVLGLFIFSFFRGGDEQPVVEEPTMSDEDRAIFSDDPDVKFNAVMDDDLDEGGLIEADEVLGITETDDDDEPDADAPAVVLSEALTEQDLVPTREALRGERTLPQN